MMLHTIERFNHRAVKHNLSAGAILLWQHLFFSMERKNQFCEVHQNTAALIAQLEITRQGLQMMRQSLENKGFLEVRVDEHQQTFYTLMIDGKVINHVEVSQSERKPNDEIVPAGTSLQKDFPAPVLQPAPEQTKGDDISFLNSAGAKNLSYYSEDIILTNKACPYIDIFCEKFGYAMRADLLDWVEMRCINGWTLTLWGLEEELKNLIELSGGDAVLMKKIAAQSVTRCWKAFHKLNVKARPSGAKLKALEAEERRLRDGQKKSVPASKFKPEGRDLSFLER